MCGGLVHPIAGRCKHCKADLASARTARPPALAALPPLARSGNPAAPVLAPAPSPEDVVALPAHAQATQIGQVPLMAPSAAPIIVVHAEPAREAYNPISENRPVLPPRPTGRMQARARGDHDRGWLARNWPVLVIVLASIAIVLAVILMVWPRSDAADAGVKNGAAGPAPERMETDPLPPPSQDPWQNGQPPTNTLPQPTPAPTPPDPDPDTTQIDPSDPLKDPFGGGLGGGSTFGNANQIGLALLGNIANRLCEKAKACSDPSVATMCASVNMFPATPLPANCPQAKRCMEIIDQMDVCDGDANSTFGGPNFPQILMRTSDCMDALTRC